MSASTIFLVAGLTHFVAAVPHATAVPGVRAWVVEVDELAAVFDDASAEHPLNAALTSCLHDGPVSEVLPLVGDRGVVVVAGAMECVVTSRGVVNVDALRLPVSWREYVMPVESAGARGFVARLVRGEAFRRARREAWRRQWERAQPGEPTIDVPACRCTLVARAMGPVVLVDGGVEVAVTEALRAQLGAYEGSYAFEPLDGGVRLVREASTMSGTCPVGDSFVDTADARWDPRARRFVVRALPAYPKTSTAPVQRRVALDFAQLPHDGGVLLEVPHSPLALTADFSVLRAGRVDRVNTRALRELIKTRCSDWPTFEQDGDGLRAEVDASSGVTRCGGELWGCALQVRFVPEQGRLVEDTRTDACLARVRRTLETASALEAEAMARWCAQTEPSGLAELTLARVLRPRSVELARAHLEVAIARGLPAKELAEARALLSER